MKSRQHRSPPPPPGAALALPPLGKSTDIQRRLALAEEYDACIKAMDDAGVPREADSGVFYTIWGRVQWMLRNRTQL